MYLICMHSKLNSLEWLILQEADDAHSAYLRVEESVSVASVGRSLVQSVVGAAGEVHVRVARAMVDDHAQYGEQVYRSC